MKTRWSYVNAEGLVTFDQTLSCEMPVNGISSPVGWANFQQGVWPVLKNLAESNACASHAGSAASSFVQPYK